MFERVREMTEPDGEREMGFAGPLLLSTSEEWSSGLRQRS